MKLNMFIQYTFANVYLNVSDHYSYGQRDGKILFWSKAGKLKKVIRPTR